MSERPSTPHGARVFTSGASGRRGEILEAALVVFSERGYDGGSMREIAMRVGVSEPALYRHFANKEALFIALIDAVAEQLRSESLALVRGMHAETLRANLLLAMADRRNALTTYGPFLRTLLTAAGHNPAFLERYRNALVLPMRDELIAVTRRLDTELRLADGDLDRESRVRAVMALFVGIFVSSVVFADTPDEAAADAILRLMRWG